jgi:hypothetical protein
MVGFSGMAVVVLATLGGAAWGWHVGSKRLYRRPIFFNSGDVETARRWRQRTTERYLLTLLYALSGAAGVAVLIAVATKH